MSKNLEKRWEKILDTVMELSSRLWYQNSKFISGVLLPSMEESFDENEYKSWFSSYVNKLAMENNWDGEFVREHVN